MRRLLCHRLVDFVDFRPSVRPMIPVQADMSPQISAQVLILSLQREVSTA
jgi:hypothetical protein